MRRGIPAAPTPSGRGYLCVIAAALLWGTSGVAGKALFEGSVTPLQLVQVRTSVATAVLAGVLLLRGWRAFRLARRDLLYVLFLGGVMAAVQLTYFYAISKIQVAAAILLQYMAPVFIAAFSMLFWHERPTPSKLLALCLAVCGCYLVVGGYDLQLLQMNSLGLLAGLTSAVAFAGYSLLGERGMHRYGPWTVLFYAMGFATLVLHLARPGAAFSVVHSAREWAGMFYVGVFGTAVPFGLYLVGINYVRATRASITATLEPIAAGVLALAFLGESLELLQLFGGACVLGAVAVLQLGVADDTMTPERLRSGGT